MNQLPPPPGFPQFQTMSGYNQHNPYYLPHNAHHQGYGYGYMPNPYQVGCQAQYPTYPQMQYPAYPQCPTYPQTQSIVPEVPSPVDTVSSPVDTVSSPLPLFPVDVQNRVNGDIQEDSNQCSTTPTSSPVMPVP